MSRVRTIAIGTFVLLLAAAPFVPRGSDPDGSLVPGASVAPGRLSPELAAEVDRVVDAGLELGRMSGKLSPEQLAQDLVRCADFDGQRYCLHLGWTQSSPADARARLARAARTAAGARTTEGTGDLDALALLRRSATADPQERADAERRELTLAALSVDKVWRLRHDLQGVSLPAGYGTTARAQQRKTRADYPRRSVIMKPSRVAEQRRTYWCGPTTMQMIAWGWQHERKKQGRWADKLGTTTDGTAISDMVRVVNKVTGYDRDSRAGKYIVLDISHWSYEKWLLLQMRHIEDYRAPVVLHPVLLKRFYPYLDDDASGHFQVGRGYDKRGDKPTQLGYFEPWNQQRFDPSEPYISRVQWRSAYKSYRANKAHFQQNIGV
jgi:hypothetical protein